MFRHSAPTVLGALLVLSFVLESTRVHADVPLPNAVVFGTLSFEGVAVSSGDLLAVVRREAGETLRVTGSFIDSDGSPLFVLRIPLEANAGAQGNNGPTARPGDSIIQLLLDGGAVTPRTPFPALAAGLLARVDADASGGAERLLRGDCNGDLGSDVADAVMVLFFLFVGNTTPPCLKACDTDGNRTVNSVDAVFLLGHLFLDGPATPPPSGSCGADRSLPGPSCEERTCPGV